MNELIKANRYRWVILGVSFLAEFQTVITRFGFSSLIPLIKPELGMTYTQAGLVSSAYFITYSAMQIPSGYISDRFSLKKVIPLSALGVGAFTILNSLTSNFLEMLVCRLAIGFAGSVIFVPLTKLIATWFPSKERGRAIGVLMTGASAGSIFASGIVPLLGSLYGWRNTFVISGALPIISATFIYKLIRERPKQDVLKKVMGRPPFKTIFREKDIWFIGLALCMAHISGGVHTWLPTFMVEKLNVEYVFMGYLLATLGIIGFPFSFISGWLSDRVGRKFLIILGSFLRIPTLILLSRISLIPVLIDILGWRLFSSFSTTVLFAYTHDVSGAEKAGAAMGFVHTFSQAGLFIGPALAGSILDITGSYTNCFDIFAILSITIAAFVYFVKTKNSVD